MIDGKLLSVFIDSFDLPAEKINEDLDTNSFEGWDSITHLQLIMNLEQAYAIVIPFDIIPTLTSVRTIIQFLDATN